MAVLVTLALLTARGLLRVRLAAMAPTGRGGVWLDRAAVDELAARLRWIDDDGGPRITTHPGTTAVIVHPGPGVPPVVLSPERVRGVTVWDLGSCGLAWRPATDAQGQGRAVTGGGAAAVSVTPTAGTVGQARPAPR